MERIGKYTVGSRIVNKNGKVVEGIYVLGKFALPWICSDLNKMTDDNSIYVFDDNETAQLYIRGLSRLYRYEFRQRAKSLGVNPGEFRYYLIKLTDSRFDGHEFGRECRSIVVKKSEEFGPNIDYTKVHIIELKKKK